MAIGGKQSRSDGWQHQANGLALKHTVIPALPRTATAQSPRHKLQQPAPTPASSGNGHRPARNGGAELPTAAMPSGKEFSRDKALDWIASARKDALAIRADRAKAAEARIAELEASLEMAMERVTFLENENQSLQDSLDLAATESLDLGRRLAESETRRDEAHSELQNSAALRAERDMVSTAAERKVELLQNTMAVKDARLRKLKETRSRMEWEIQELVEAATAREQALADAEQRVLVLTELFEQLELSLDDASEAQYEKLAPVIQNLTSLPRPGERPDARQAVARTPPSPVLPSKAAQSRTLPPQARSSQTRLSPIISPKEHPIQNRSAQAPPAQESPSEVRIWRRELDTDDWLLGRPVRQ